MTFANNANNSSATRLSILVIDDDEATICLIKRMLNKLPHWQIQYASYCDITQPLPRLETGDPDVVIVDYLLGMQNGLEMIRKLQQLGWSSSYILMTGHGDERVAAEAMRAGVHDYIIKTDLSMETLDRSLRYVSDHRQARLELQQLNQQLEQRVEQRTEELLQVNNSLNQTLSQLREAQGELIESEKMAALGALVAGIAHEINTPIGVSITASSLLTDLVEQLDQHRIEGTLTRQHFEQLTSKLVECNNIIFNNLQRSGEMINNFKQVAVDQTSGEKREFNVNQYLQEIISTLKPQLASNKHQVKITGAEDLTMLSYPGAFYQIISNLVINSIIHGFDNTQQGTILINLDSDQHNLCVEYQDDGHGMSKETLTHLFEPFYTTRRGQGGSGLGTHIIYNLITQKFKGSIECHSAPGQGCVFSIRLPLKITV